MVASAKARTNVLIMTRIGCGKIENKIADRRDGTKMKNVIKWRRQKKNNAHKENNIFEEQNRFILDSSQLLV
jgi:hypothetical protein